MAIVEEISDDSSAGQATPPIDDIEVEELDPLPASPPAPSPSSSEPKPPLDASDAVNNLRKLVASSSPAADVSALLSSPEVTSLPLEEQANLVFPFLRTPNPPQIPDPAAIAQQVLQSNVRSLFLSNPNVSASGRAQKPSTALLDDASHDQAWKIDGIHYALRWCGEHLPSPTSRLSLILPPTLTMMDDWDPVWRTRGVDVLRSWVFEVAPDDLRSRGLDSLLLGSLEHTLSLHEDTPGVLDVAVRLVEGLKGKEKAAHYTELVEKDLVAGWKYAKRERQAQIARDTEVLCRAMGEGIARWTKEIIPSLLSPLQFPPTPSTLELTLANLSALQTFITTVDTFHTARWRGQILAILARSWVMHRERWPEVTAGDAQPAKSTTDGDVDMDAREDSDPQVEGQVASILATIKRIYAALADLPGVKDNFNTLLKTNKQIFAPLVSPLVA